MNPLEFTKRVKYSFYATLVFLILTNPITLSTLESIFGFSSSSTGGYFILAALFFCCILGLMMFPL